MTSFESSARVSMNITGPEIVQSRVSQARSLMVMAPTLLDLSSNPSYQYSDLVSHIAGRCLRSLIYGSADNADFAISEYCTESKCHPNYELWRDCYKCIHCGPDLPLLFDLGTGLQELKNANP